MQQDTDPIDAEFLRSSTHLERNDDEITESKRHLNNSLSKAGIPLVLRSEQKITISKEEMEEISLLQDKNSHLDKMIREKENLQIDDEEYLIRTANFYFVTEHNQKAIEYYDIVLRHNPVKMAALNDKGVALDSNGEHNEALTWYNKALAHVSENVHVLCNKGISLYKIERYEEALESFDVALKLDSNYTNALTFKGHALYKMGKNKDALECYNKAIRLDGDNAEALYNKACLCSLKGDEYGAFTSLKKAIHLEPFWKEVASNDKDLEYLRKNHPIPTL